MSTTRILRVFATRTRDHPAGTYYFFRTQDAKLDSFGSFQRCRRIVAVIGHFSFLECDWDVWVENVQ